MKKQKKSTPVIVEITPTPHMTNAAKALNTGRLICVYRDGNAVRAETEHGEDPYVWREATKTWTPMQR